MAAPAQTASWRTRAALRPREVAEVSGLSLRTVQRQIASGDLPSHRRGRCRLVPIAAVLELVGAEPAPEARVAAAPTIRRRADEILAHIRRKHG